MQITIETQIDDQTAAAIVAAIELLFQEQVVAMPASEASRSAWSVAGMLANQGLPAARADVTWSSADRIK